jgi:hypothetical protein
MVSSWRLDIIGPRDNVGGTNCISYKVQEAGVFFKGNVICRRSLPVGVIWKMNIIELMHRVTNKRIMFKRRPARTVRNPLITLKMP